MKISPFILFLLIPFIGCNEIIKNYQDSQQKEKELKDSIKKVVETKTEKFTTDLKKSMEFDTVGVSTAPIKIIKYKLVDREYSNYKDMVITCKNISSKPIEGIRFRWYGETVFGDPAHMGSMIFDGFGTGESDEKLGIGKNQTLHWSMISRDAKKNIQTWPTEVVFSDGSKWQSKTDSNIVDKLIKKDLK